MKKPIFILLFLLPLFGFAQEVCNNGIDDDLDGLIDLNDPDCYCERMDSFTSLIPNSSFEDTLCCPMGGGDVGYVCLEDWIQASFGSSCEYYHTCSFIAHPGDLPPEIPLIDGGDAFTGFGEAGGVHEMTGTCLISPMLAGVSYQLELYLAWANGNTSINLSLYGTPDCADLPWAGVDCPIGFGAWDLLDDELVIVPVDGSWQKVTFIYTPAIDINAIAIGGTCGWIPGSGYYYLDGLTLVSEDHFTEITRTGDWCDGDLQLSTGIDTIGGTWQWYKNGIALVGETGESVNVNDYGMGTYTAEYSLGGQCLRLSHAVFFADALDADFTAENVCFGEPIDFANTSTIPEGGSPMWQWNFGDGGTSTAENPSHTYGIPGTYTVELIGINDLSCNDTTRYEVTVYELPTVDFEFSGGCIINPVSFADLSTAADEITSWSWNFGDGSTAAIENPTHTYGTIGTYTVTLTVTTSAGCSASTTQLITMTNGLPLELVINEPTCFGFSDGSIVVTVEDPLGEVVFTIKDADGTILNIDNSNVANTLPTGWYYIEVEDESECAGKDSIFLNQPSQLNSAITTNDPLCYGDNTGWARVDSVYNATGSYAAIDYNWNPNPANNNGLGADSTWNLTAGDYLLTINDENGCSRSFNFTINQPDSLYFTEFGYEPAYCRLYDYQSGNGVVKGAAAGGTPDYNYTWKNTDTGEETTSTTWGGLNPGNYEFTATDNNGCVLIKSLYLDSLNPIADFTITSIQLNADHKGTAPVEVVFENQSENFANPNNPLADTTFFWNLNHPQNDWQLSTSYFETFDTTYQARGDSYEVNVCLVAMNKNGCTDTTCKIITIFEPIAFANVNIFSPNNDGKNDVFTFDYKAASIAEFNCIITNRWGEVVAEITTINGFWDGTNQQGNNCTNGVYFYTYTAVTDNGTKLKGQGTVELVGR